MFGASAARTSTRSCSLSPSWLLAGRGFRYARMDRRHPRVAASHGKVQSRQTCTHRGAERVCLWTPLQLHNGYISIRDGIWVSVLSLSHVWAGPTSAWLWAGPGRGPVARSHAPLHTTLCSCCRACCGTGAARRCWSSVFWAVAQRAAPPPAAAVRRAPPSPVPRAASFAVCRCAVPQHAGPGSPPPPHGGHRLRVLSPRLPWFVTGCVCASRHAPRSGLLPPPIPPCVVCILRSRLPVSRRAPSLLDALLFGACVCP